MVHSVFDLEHDCGRMQIPAVLPRNGSEPPPQLHLIVPVGMGAALPHSGTGHGHYHHPRLHEWVGFLDPGQFLKEKRRS